MRGVAAWRAGAPGGGAGLDLRILSAGYGLVPGDQRLVPYEVTFTGMGPRARQAWAAARGIPAAVRAALAGPSDLGLLLLGDAYLAACALDGAVRLGGPTLVVCSAGPAARLPALPGLRPVVLARADAGRFHCGQVGLKGEVGGRLLAALAADPARLGAWLAPGADILGELAALPPTAGGAVPRGAPAAPSRPARPAATPAAPAPGSGGKYAPLQAWLAAHAARGAPTLTVSFAAMEAVLGAALPDSARTHRAWWGNQGARAPQARAWQDAGWLVDGVALAAGRVTFRRG